MFIRCGNIKFIEDSFVNGPIFKTEMNLSENLKFASLILLMQK